MADVPRSSKLTDLDQSQRLGLLVDAVKDYAIYLLDADGLVATWNTGAQLFKGYGAAEIIGRHFSVFYTEEDRSAGLPARALHTAETEGRFESEGWRGRKDGTRFWTHVIIDQVFDDTGELIGYAKITRDVSERRAADRALYESEQRFRLLVQGVHDYAIYMLDPAGVITNWNAGAEAIKGYKAGEIVGKHFSLFYTDEDRVDGKPARALETALREGRFEGEAQRVRKGGERFWANVIIDPIHDDHGQLLGFAKITRDVTEKRRAAEEIETAREALVQAQKMEAIGRLTGGVAHDFNNLLTVIRASADFLRRSGLSEDKRARYVEAIASTAERAAVLTSQLLAFARRQPLQPEVFDVATRLRGLSQIVGTTIGSSVDFKLDLAAGEQLVFADPSQFETAVLNMVINARDAMPRGGEIKVVTGRTTSVPAVRGHAAASGDFVTVAAASGDFVTVAIVDNGSGMAPDVALRVFEPFFTTKDINKGTGLGLSQVYGFAKQSAGEIDVASTVDVGTTFTLYLPRAAGAVPTAARRAVDPVDLADLPERRILLVEDNEGVGHFARELLTELGQTVTWAGDAQAALYMLEDRSEAFDVVFSDVVMPGMSGVELAQQIARRWPHLEVILTSGYSHVLVEEGTHGFPLLKKPYSIEGLVQVLGRKAAD